MYSIHAFAAIASRRDGGSSAELLTREEKKTPAPERLKIRGTARIFGVRFDFVVDVDLCTAAPVSPSRGAS
jgi:hypothetical protein